MSADPAERPKLASSDREERLLALEELKAIGILRRDEFVAEIRSLTDPQPKLDPHRRRRRRLPWGAPRWRASRGDRQHAPA
jgi:hypothetical protein